MGAVVSPDGRFIYYAQRTGTFTYNARFPLWQIYRHDRETGDVSQVTNAQGSAMRPVLSPDGKWLVYATRHKTDTGLRIRNLETGAERWLAYPVTRDDQESRASRDTLPRYDFMPDGKSLVVPIAGKLQRIDVATGAGDADSVHREGAGRNRAARLHAGAHRRRPEVRARLIRWPTLSPDGTRLVFSALNHLYVMDCPGGTPRRSRPADEGEFMPAWSPDGQSIVYITWTTAGGHIKRVPAAGGAAADADARTRATTSIRSSRPTARAWCSSPAPPPTSSTRSCSTRRRPTSRRPDGRGGDRRHQPAQHARDPLDAGRRRRADARRLGAGRPRPAFRAQDNSTRVYFTTPRGLQSITLDGLDRRTHRAGPGRRARATTRRRPTTSGCRPTARAPSSACRTSIT